MEKKLPKVFANKVEKKVGNNNDVYYSNFNNVQSEKVSNVVSSEKKKNINQKINEIFSSSNYIYKADVILTLKDETITRRIVGRNSTHLITIDNELISLTDIINIEKK